MHVVDVVAGLDGTDHALQRAMPVFICEAMPIALDAALCPALGEHGNKAAVPVGDRTPSVEGQHLDSLHSAFQPARTRAAGTMKLLTISLSRSSVLACRASRRAWIAAPAAASFQNQSPSWRLDGLAEPAAPASR